MYFRNNLYTVSKRQIQDGSARFDLLLDAEHMIYKAHFPGQPITPGVCLLQMARELLEDITELTLEILSVKNVKFLSVVSPIELPQITFTLSHIAMDEGGVECRAQVSAPDDHLLAKLSFKCKIRDKQ